jgi:uncharacterized protein (DUF433 family)
MAPAHRGFRKTEKSRAKKSREEQRRGEGWHAGRKEKPSATAAPSRPAAHSRSRWSQDEERPPRPPRHPPIFFSVIPSEPCQSPSERSERVPGTSAQRGCLLWNGLRESRRSGLLLGVRFEKYITVKPGVRNGKPCLKGTRITVTDVLEYLAGGMTEAQILADFPALKPEHIRACLAFAAARERRLASSAA